MMRTTENQAHLYADYGWPVFPVTPNRKEPFPGSNGCKDATRDHDQIRGWWSGRDEVNIGIATGWPGPDVLDVDNHGINASGFGALNRLKKAGLVPAPKAIISTPSGGMHLYYEGTNQGNGHIAAAHIDYRGKGGYVLAPPSQVDGHPYVVAEKAGSREVCNWGAIREELTPAPEKPAYVPRDGQGLDHLVTWVERQEQGNRNAGLHWAGMRAVEAGQPELIEDLAAAAVRGGHPEREARATAASLWRAAGRPETSPEREAG